ncbi:hypothetical protein KKA14_20255 [bacterium]|nr:hypothetical protein [bacterium]
MLLRQRVCFVCVIILILIFGTVNPLFGQDGANTPPVLIAKTQPPMENVFFNVLWGSVAGGTLMMGWTTVDDSVPSDERYGVSYLGNQFLGGATYGAVIGLIVGVYLSMKGIAFDESRSRIALLPLAVPDAHPRFGLTENVPDAKHDDLYLMNIQIKF